MYKVETFRKHWAQENSLGREVEYFLNNNQINREDIIDIKYTVNNDWLYCMIVWEE